MKEKEKEKELPELPSGWQWRTMATGKPYASFIDEGVSADVFVDEDGLNIDYNRSANRWWAPSAVVVAVLKANGVEL